VFNPNNNTRKVGTHGIEEIVVQQGYRTCQTTQQWIKVSNPDPPHGIASPLHGWAMLPFPYVSTQEIFTCCLIDASKTVSAYVSLLFPTCQLYEQCIDHSL
jgi:hypothetical protein